MRSTSCRSDWPGSSGRSAATAGRGGRDRVRGRAHDQLRRHRGRHPRFVRIIPVDLAADLFAPAGLVPAAASPDGWVARRAFAEVGPVETGADPSLTDLVGRLRSTLRFYAGREGAEPISRMYLTGAGLTAPGLAAAVASGLDVPVTELGMHDLIAFSKSISAIGTPPPSLVNALGIALGDDK